MDNNRNWMKYAGMAFQMIATLGVAFFIGYKLDEYLGSKPICLLLLPLLALGGVFYQILKDTNNKK